MHYFLKFIFGKLCVPQVPVTVHREQNVEREKTNRMHLVGLLSSYKTLLVSDSSSVHHQEFFTVLTAIHTGLLTACEQDQDGTS